MKTPEGQSGTLEFVFHNEELLAQRGFELSYKTIRCWTIKFGPQIAADQSRP